MKLIHEIEQGEMPRHRLLLEGPERTEGQWTRLHRTAWLRTGSRTFCGEVSLEGIAREYECTQLEIERTTIEGRAE